MKTAKNPFYVRCDGTLHGPYAKQDIADLLRRGALSEVQSVMTEDGNAVAQVRDFRNAFVVEEEEESASSMLLFGSVAAMSVVCFTLCMSLFLHY